MIKNNVIPSDQRESRNLLFAPCRMHNQKQILLVRFAPVGMACQIFGGMS